MCDARLIAISIMSAHGKSSLIKALSVPSRLRSAVVKHMLASGCKPTCTDIILAAYYNALDVERVLLRVEMVPCEIDEACERICEAGFVVLMLFDKIVFAQGTEPKILVVGFDLEGLDDVLEFVNRCTGTEVTFPMSALTDVECMRKVIVTICTEFGHNEMLGFILQLCEMDKTTLNKALRLATVYLRPYIVETLLRFGADIQALQDAELQELRFCMPTLRIVLAHGKQKVAERILLSIAQLECDKEVIDALLEHGAR